MTATQELILPSLHSTTLSSYLLVVRYRDQIVDSSGNETVILSLINNKRYELGSIGSRIWSLIQEPIAIGEVVNVLLDEYHIDRMTCEADVFSFLTRLSEERLIQFGVCG